jgi:hypothetical protein
MKPTWKITEDAYLVTALHFAKHGNSDVVFGLLLGKDNEVIEAIPLFHSFVLNPSLLVGMALASEYAKSRGYEIVGAYSKTAPALKLALSMLKLKTSPIDLLFSEDNLTRDKCMFSSENGIVECDHESASLRISELIAKNVYIKVADLDEHFVDPRNDFLSNKNLLGK